MNLYKKLKSCFCCWTFLCPLSNLIGLPFSWSLLLLWLLNCPYKFSLYTSRGDFDKRIFLKIEAFHSFSHPAAAWVDFPRIWLMVLSVFIHYSKPQDLTVAFVSELMWFCFFRGEERVCFNHMAMNWASFSKKTAYETSFTKTTVKP